MMPHFFSFHLKVLIFTYFVIFFNQYIFIWFCNYIYEKAFFFIFNLVWPISFYISVTINGKFLSSLLLLIYWFTLTVIIKTIVIVNISTIVPSDLFQVSYIWQVSGNFEPSSLFNPWEEVVPLTVVHAMRHINLFILMISFVPFTEPKYMTFFTTWPQ